MTENEKKLLQFPCEFPVKIIGRAHEEFVANILTVTQKFFPEFNPEHLQTNSSKEKNFISVTLILFAENQAQLDALYQELTKLPQVVMVL